MQHFKPPVQILVKLLLVKIVTVKQMKSPRDVLSYWHKYTTIVSLQDATIDCDRRNNQALTLPDF